ncbi:MAG TPA: LacI family DNA-binding transcriptional regulator [Candidatus Competibacter sp.]|nr:LacI family DNA-binding transcriptional regulator [Candidatus Competibacter sp.]
MIKQVDSTGLSAANTKRVTINEVARDARVSKTSVSRYLGGERHLLSDGTRDQIERSIAKLDYQPNQMARGLKRGRTRLVGMIIADILNPYSIAVMHGIEAACRQHGYTLMICNSNNDERAERGYLEILQSYSVEGVILHACARSAANLGQIVRYQAPIVLVDRKLANFDTDLVGLDNYQSTITATSHLIDQGYRDLVFVTEALQGFSTRLEREAAFHLTVRQHPECMGFTLALDVNDAEQLDRELRNFLTNDGAGPKAVLTTNGVVTLQVSQSLRRLGCRLFEDIGLLGFDELEWSTLIGTGITTIAQPTHDIGIAAMDCLLRRWAGDRSASRHITFRGQLLVRGSTTRPPSEQQQAA